MKENYIVKTGIEKIKQVQAFCEENGLKLELGAILCAESNVGQLRNGVFMP